VRRVLARVGVPTQPHAAPRASLLDPYRAFVHEMLEKYPNLHASRLYAMVRERGYPGGPDHFRHLVALVRPRPPAEAFLRLRTLPGEHYGKTGVMGCPSANTQNRPCMDT
jgi:transposase